MTRTLITGGGGFAGGHLRTACEAAGEEVMCVARSGGDVRADLTDAAQAREAVAAARPDVVHHLAARAHVGTSWREPGAYLHDNVAMTLNLLEAVREEAPGAVVVLASSGEVYGPPERLPVDESAALRPQNPYAVSKASSDLLGGFYADAHGLRVVRARSFNHAGPGQEPTYAIASFTRQVAEGLERGDDAVRIVTGNPSTLRDYTDVRDVVAAYRALAAQSEPGVFNVCSGSPHSAGDVLSRLGSLLGVEIDHHVDPALVRAHEVMEVRGSHDALTAATGWEPSIGFDTTLADTVEWWRAELRAGRAGAVAHE